MFATAVLTSGIILLAGYFPAHQLPVRQRSVGWRSFVWLNVLLHGGVGVAAFFFALSYLSWPVAVIAGGLSLLLAPPLYQYCLDKLGHRCAGLALQSLASGLILIVLCWMVASVDA